MTAAKAVTRRRLIAFSSPHLTSFAPCNMCVRARTCGSACVMCAQGGHCHGTSERQGVKGTGIQCFTQGQFLEMWRKLECREEGRGPGMRPYMGRHDGQHVVPMLC